MSKRSINLLQESAAPPTFWERFYDWVTNSARVIVIITEGLVLIAFGFRFVLDRRLNDIKDSIEEKGSTLKILAEQEDSIRLLQSKISAYDSLWDSSSYYTAILADVNNYVPSETSELEVSVSDQEGVTTLYIKGELERALIDELENNFKDSANYRDVTLSTIERQSAEDIYEFSLSAKYNENKLRENIGSYENSESET